MNDKLPVVEVKHSEFEALINHNALVFVDFWATWCGPCRQFSSVYAQVAALHPEVTFSKVNIQEETELAELFNIQSIPHLMVFKQGIAIYSESGSMPKSVLIDLVKQATAVDVSEIREQINNENI